MRAAARATTARLPITADVHTVHLFQGSDAPDAWHSVTELPLGEGQRIGRWRVVEPFAVIAE